MKLITFRWRSVLALAAALACQSSIATAQLPFKSVDLGKPVDTLPVAPVPVPVESPELADEPAAPAGNEFDETHPRELIRERFPNGATRVEREMIQDDEGNFVRHGLYREYDIKGTLIVEGRFNQGRREGTWRRIHAASDSPLFQTTPYKDFPGPYISQVNFKAGAMDGKWIIADSRQRKISEIAFENGDRHGDAVWFYTNGMLMTQIGYDRGRVNGEVVKWGSDSTVLAKETYQHGRKISPKTEYFSNQSKKSEITYLHAMLFMGTPDNWDKAELATFETRGQDERHGTFMLWHPTGNLARQAEFRYNLPVGKVVYWYENGQKQMEGSYSDGKQHGSWNWYHNNGQKSIAGEYNEGVAVGTWMWWKEDGQVAQKVDMSAQRQSATVVRGLPQPPVASDGDVQPLR